MNELEKAKPENCQVCFRPTVEPGAPATTQWISVCRCDRPYSPNSKFSIDLCRNCKRRIPAIVATRLDRQDLCTCSQPVPITVPKFTKQNENDAIDLDLASIGMSNDNFPLERYKPLGILGLGPKANVVLARDKQRGTKVAVKCFKQMAPETQASLDLEAKKYGKLNHTNIAKIIDHGIMNGTTPYIVTEYKDGFNLDQYIDLHGTPSHDVAISIMMAICEALVYAYKEGFQHRNLKPGNVFFVDDMNSEPAVFITDFSMPKSKLNLNRLEPSDAFFMSSDEARNMEHDEKSEVYSIGCVGFALLAGRPPFQTGTVRDIKNKHALELPPRISDLNFERERPKDLEEVVERCLEKDPRNRFDTVAKLLERLTVFPTREKNRIAGILAARKRKKLMIVGGAVLVVVVLLSLIALIFVH